MPFNDPKLTSRTRKAMSTRSRREIVGRSQTKTKIATGTETENAKKKRIKTRKGKEKKIGIKIKNAIRKRIKNIVGAAASAIEIAVVVETGKIKTKTVSVADVVAAVNESVVAPVALEMVAVGREALKNRDADPRGVHVIRARNRVARRGLETVERVRREDQNVLLHLLNSRKRVSLK